MYKVLIVSDSHGLTQELIDIKNRHDFPFNIHCGDVQLYANSNYIEDYLVVRGNCDWDTQFKKDEVFSIGNIRFFVTHGHLYQVKDNLVHLEEEANRVDADIICFGHTHIAHAQTIENRLYLNPGSFRLPKGTNSATYTTIEWESSNKVDLQYYNMAGDVVKSFTFNLSN